MQPSPSAQPPSNPGNSDIQYFKTPEKIYPRRVSGKYRNLKWLAMIVTLGIYYLAPFIRWDRGPNAPDQAILIDLPNRRAYWFFIEIWPQEVYYLAAILVFAAIALFFATALFGRVWCGYFCPQTVWTDLFVWVERIVQGDRVARQRLDQAPWSLSKVFKLSLTYLLWFGIAFFTAGAFVLYFNDAPTLVTSFFQREVSPTVLGFMSALTLSTFIMAGRAREQVCIYMCPYARFQSAMFDPETLIIGYDARRGEPRGKHKKGESWENRGHCIDCTACVQVCPMGIDIRNGLQIECIACGLCVDACNDIMDKVNLPRGLIRYDTDAGLQGAPHAPRFVRPRTVYYMLILAAVAALVVYAMVTRQPSELHILHDRNPLYVRMSDGAINNGYDVRILNKTHEDRVYSLSVEGLEGATLKMRSGTELDPARLAVPADSVATYHVFVRAPEQAKDQADIRFTLTDGDGSWSGLYESMFISRGAQ